MRARAAGPSRATPCESRVRPAALVLTGLLALVPAITGAQPVISPTISQVFSGGTVSVIARQADGKVIIGGSFDHVRGVARNGFARLNADGTLDTAWDPNPDGGIAAVAVGTGGSVFVSGSFTHIGGLARGGLAKLSGSGAGAADATWDPKPDGGVYCVTVDSGGNVYAGGTFLHIGGRARSRIAKLSPSGTGAADAVWDPSANSGVFAVVLDGSGSLYVAGVFNNIGGQARSTIAKLSAGGAGAADAAWDPHPTMLYVGGVGAGRLNCLALDGNGHVYVGGFFDHIGGLARGCLARLSTGGTGAADPAWNTRANGEIVTLAVDGSGNAFVGGVFSVIGAMGIPGLAKVTSSEGSSVDSYWVPLSWAPEGWIVPGIVSNVPIYALATDASGHVYVGGTFTHIGGQTQTGFAVLSTGGGGAADPAWSSVMTTGSVLALARDGAGRTVIGGSFQFMGDGVTVRNNIARLNSDNTLDTAWAPETNGEVDALAVDQASGDVYAAGKFTGAGGLARNRIAKLSGAGTGAANVSWNPNADGEVIALALDSAGGYLYAGGTFAGIGGQARGSIARLSTSATGAASGSWSPSATPPATALHTVRALVLDGAGRLYVGGNFTALGGSARKNVARVTASSGAVDPSWNPSADGPVDALALDGAAVYVGGEFGNVGAQPRASLARLSSAGSGGADPAWNPKANGGVSALAPDGHGGVFVGGGFTLVGGGVRSLVARIVTGGAGAADCNWIVDFRGYTIASGGAPVALATDASGNVYAGGQFSRVGGAPCPGYAVLGPATRTTGCRLAITNVNSGVSPSVGFGFAVGAQSEDSLGTAQSVMTDTGVTLSRQVGSGTLGGTLTCQLAAGSSACSAPAVTYSKAETGVVIRASGSGGDPLFAPGDSAPFTVIATPPPSRLAFSSVNGGSNPVVGAPFSLTVQARDATGTPQIVTVATAVSLVLNTGTGVLGGAGSCQIAAGASSCTAAGKTYSKAEAGVILTAYATYGAAALAGNSQPLTVTESSGTRVLTVLNPFDGHVTSSPPGLDCSAGKCSAPFPIGAAVTLTYTAGGSFGFVSWGGACSGSSASCQLTLSGDSTVTVNATTLAGVTSTSSEAIQSTTSVAGAETRRVDQTRTRLIGRFDAANVYDRTFNVPFANAVVQAAVTAAGNAIGVAAHGAPVRVSSPVQTAASDTILSSVQENTDDVGVTVTVAANNIYIGPQTIVVGYQGPCTGAPSCPGPFATLAIKPAFLVMDVLTTTKIQTTRTVVTTETHRIDATYEIEGVRRGHLRRVLPARP